MHPPFLRVISSQWSNTGSFSLAAVRKTSLQRALSITDFPSSEKTRIPAPAIPARSEGSLPFCRTFGDVGKGELLAYTNELMNISFTMNAESIVARYGIGYGSDWLVSFEKVG